MKQLFLVRHAKSSWKDTSLTDFERPLNKRGKRDAPFMGKLFYEMNIKPDLIISSTAVRAYTTAKTVAENIGYPVEKIEATKFLYECNSNELIDFIRSVDNKINSLMIFGHNPTLTLTHNYLSDKRIDNIPTCALAAIEFYTDNWKKIEIGSGRNFLFEYPKKYL